MAQRSSLPISLSFWWLLLFGFLPACASLLSPSPDPGAGMLSNMGATCTVTNPQGPVVPRPAARFATEGARSQESALPPGEPVKAMGTGTRTTADPGNGLGVPQ